ncbi:MAG: SDR family oxidoreductase [Anaerolineales bacterium]|nr:SDR family oxidoreductase [Anaerolineales bacterium]
MKTLVITGSTRGIGFGLAREFLKRGCSVVINGRTPAVVEKAVSELAATHGRERVFGHAADVSIYEQTEGLWEAARARFGRVDVWVNNAGIAHPIDIPLWDQPPEQMRAVVGLNLLGTLYGVRIAGRGMKAQGGGTIYLMEGFGSDGRTRGGLGLYGATKAALRYAAKALKADTAEWATPVKFGTISPGIVITDMIIGQYTGREQEFERAKRVFNILGDRVETVTPFIADKVLAGDLRIAWLTPGKVFWRFLTANFNKRNLFEEGAKAS